jgi:hypothetical protein
MFILTLEVAGLVISVTAKCYLGLPPIQHIENRLVCNIAHLVIFVYDVSVLVADSPILGGHHSIAGLVLRANIAVDARPSFFTLAGVALPHWSILFSIC